jgi:hypothetical protein
VNWLTPPQRTPEPTGYAEVMGDSRNMWSSHNVLPRSYPWDTPRLWAQAQPWNKKNPGLWAYPSRSVHPRDQDVTHTVPCHAQRSPKPSWRHAHRWERDSAWCGELLKRWRRRWARGWRQWSPSRPMHKILRVVTGLRQSSIGTERSYWERFRSRISLSLLNWDEKRGKQVPLGGLCAKRMRDESQVQLPMIMTTSNEGQQRSIISQAHPLPSVTTNAVTSAVTTAVTTAHALEDVKRVVSPPLPLRMATDSVCQHLYHSCIQCFTHNTGCTWRYKASDQRCSYLDGERRVHQFQNMDWSQLYGTQEAREP